MKLDHSLNKSDDDPKAEMVQIFSNYLYAVKPDGSPAVNISNMEKARRLDKFIAELRRK
jgi:hypothetical protein